MRYITAERAPLLFGFTKLKVTLFSKVNLLLLFPCCVVSFAERQNYLKVKAQLNRIRVGKDMEAS